MSWRLCAGGVTLRDQINQTWPKRDRASDGSIGDAAHAARDGWGLNGRGSYHNPDPKGIVHAIDIDENLGVGRFRNGRQARILADELAAYAASGLPGADRIVHIVYEDQVASGTDRRRWWQFRGSGYGHTAHIHVSFSAKADNDGRLFPLPCLATSTAQRQRWAADLKRRA